MRANWYPWTALLVSYRASVNHFSKPNRATYWAIVVSVLIAIALFLVADFDNLQSRIASVPPLSLLIASVAMMIQLVISGLRLTISFGNQRIAIVPAIEISAIHQITVRLLPARLSEIVWGIMVMRASSRTLSHVLAILIAIRIWDLRVLLAALAIFLAFVFPSQFAINSAGFGPWLLTAAIGLLLVLLVVLPTQKFAAFCEISSRWMRRANLLRSVRLFGLKVLRHLPRASGANWIVQAVLATLAWTASLVSTGALLQAFVPELGFALTAIVLIVMLFASIVPLPALGVIGVGEIGLAASLVSMGYNSALGAEVALLLAGFHSLMSYAVGMFLFVVCQIMRRSRFEVKLHE